MITNESHNISSQEKFVKSVCQKGQNCPFLPFLLNHLQDCPFEYNTTVESSALRKNFKITPSWNFHISI